MLGLVSIKNVNQNKSAFMHSARNRCHLSLRQDSAGGDNIRLIQLQTMNKILSVVSIFKRVHQKLKGILVDDPVIQETGEIELFERHEGPNFDKQFHPLFGKEASTRGCKLVNNHHPVFSKF